MGSYYSLRLSDVGMNSYYYNNIAFDLFLQGDIVSFLMLILILLCAPIYFRMPKNSLAFWAFLCTTNSVVMYTATLQLAYRQLPRWVMVPEIVGLLTDVGGMVIWMRFWHTITRHAMDRECKWDTKVHRVLSIIFWACAAITGVFAIVFMGIYCSIYAPVDVGQPYFYDYVETPYVAKVFNCLCRIFWATQALVGAALSSILIRRIYRSKTSLFLKGERIWLYISLSFVAVYSFWSMVLHFANLRQSGFESNGLRMAAWYFLTLSTAGIVFSNARLMVFWMRVMYSINFQDAEDVELVNMAMDKKGGIDGSDSSTSLAPPNRSETGFKSTFSLHLGGKKDSGFNSTTSLATPPLPKRTDTGLKSVRSFHLGNRTDTGYHSGSSETAVPDPERSYLNLPSPMSSPTESTAALNPEQSEPGVNIEEEVVKLPFKPIVRIPVDLEKVEFTIIKISEDDGQIERIRAYVGR